MTSINFEAEYHILKKENEILKKENIKITKQRENYFNQRRRVTKKWKQAVGEIFLLKQDLVRRLTDEEIQDNDILINTDNNL